MGEQECGNCRFWKPWVGEGDGLCRRYPPAFAARVIEPLEVESGDLGPDDGYWPQTDAGDWCGEWRAGPEDPDAG